MTTIRTTAYASALATALALAAPGAHAQGSWAKVGVSKSMSEPGYVGRLEGGGSVAGLPMNYGFADLTRDAKGNESLFGQAQFTKEFGNKPVKPTIGAEYQFATGLRDGTRIQLGANAAWSNGFAGLRVAPRLDALALGTDNDVQISLNGQHTYRRATIGAWGDLSLNAGKTPGVFGEGYGMIKLGDIKGKGVSASVYIPYTQKSVGLRLGTRIDL